MTDLNLLSNTIKGLAMDAVQKAKSGHPGTPMGMADIAAVLWSEYLVVDPDHPDWPNRDRFVLSNGHASMLLYSLLHLSGFPVSMDDLKSFRQLGSHTAGHPEIDHALGIEMTTGPLGQGFGTAVGLALAEAHLRATVGEDLIDHRTWVFCSDGDLMEGVSAESSSIAGHLALDRLTYFYDDNNISIDGSTSITFSETVAGRFEAVGWHVEDIDGHDHAAIREATDAAVAETSKPTMIICHTHIADGAPNAHDTAKSHGSPLGEDEIRLAKEGMGFDPDQQFFVPDQVTKELSTAMDRGRTARTEWQERYDALDSDRRDRFDAQWQVGGSVKITPPPHDQGESLATRAAMGEIFDTIAENVPGFIGGAADLVESTKTEISTSSSFSADDRTGRNVHFGIREHAMGTIVNGMAVHGGLRPYGATFFVFSDYMRPAVRISALMKAPSIWVYTHDSVFLGEDGPTHQPIEHLASLRAMPNLWVMRPADAGETVEVWETALARSDGPVAMLFTRQGVPVLERPTGGVARGGYVLRPGNDLVLVATGSEVHVAIEAAEMLSFGGTSARVVSLPCWELFFEQDQEYRDEVLGVDIPLVSIEAASTFGWERVIGLSGLAIGIDHFGASAPAPDIAEAFGLTPTAVADRVRAWMADPV